MIVDHLRPDPSDDKLLVPVTVCFKSFFESCLTFMDSAQNFIKYFSLKIKCSWFLCYFKNLSPPLVDHIFISITSITHFQVGVLNIGMNSFLVLHCSSIPALFLVSQAYMIFDLMNGCLARSPTAVPPDSGTASLSLGHTNCSGQYHLLLGFLPCMSFLILRFLLSTPSRLYTHQ